MKIPNLLNVVQNHTTWNITFVVHNSELNRWLERVILFWNWKSALKNVKICSKLLSSVPIYCKSMGKEQYL